jgi:hypothetical protein
LADLRTFGVEETMLTRSFLVAACGTIVTLLSFSALADGTITSVTPSPSPGLACSLNTIKISGTGTCGTFTFQLGDSTPVVHLPGNFPISVYHTYSSARTYPLTAQGEGNCHGVVKANLQVVGPTITSFFPFSVIKPGGSVILEGQNFGNLPGQILINIPSLHSFTGIPLGNIQWGNTFASGTIPAGISGVPDQQVNFTVVAQCGAVSNSLSAKFTATRAMQLVPYSWVQCWPGVLASNDACQGLGGPGWPPECGFLNGTFGLGQDPTGFWGYHVSGWGNGESSTDFFYENFALINGWVFDSVQNLGWAYVGGGSTAAVDSKTSSPGDPSPRVYVDWHADACGLIDYTGDIQITGPKGLPAH